MHKVKMCMFALGCCFVFGLGSESYSTEQDGGLVAYFSMDEINGNILPDKSGNNNNGTITGNLSLIEGKKGKALFFDGKGTGYVMVAPSESLNNLTEFTVMGWLKYADLFALEGGKDNYPTFINRGKEDQYPEFWLFSGFHKGGKWSYERIANRIGKIPEWQWTKTAQSSVLGWEKDCWYHIAVVTSARESIMRFYRNGEEVGASKIPADYSFGTKKLYIGSYQGSGTEWQMKGLIDEVKIYNRTLSNEEIEEICPVSRVIIQGRVFLDKNKNEILDKGEKGLRKIPVSDGDDIILTSDTGSYSFKVSAQKPPAYIFVSMPSGYKAIGNFYYPIRPFKHQPGGIKPVREGDYHSVNFALYPDKLSKRKKFSFIQITDIHMRVNRELNITSDMIDLSKLDTKPDFIIDTGDMIDGYENENGFIHQWQAYKRAIKNAKLPFHNVIGNHDTYSFTGERSSYDAFSENNIRTFVGITYYSFDYGNFHFVILDQYENYLKQLSWLKKDLSLQPENKPIFIFQHEPPSNKFLDSLSPYNVKAVITGHYHCNRNYLYKGIYDINCSPFSMGGRDLCPAGFNIFFVDNDSFKLTHRLSHIHEKTTIVSPDKIIHLSKNGQIEVLANIYDTSSTKLRVQCSLDQNNWQDMVQAGEWSWKGEICLIEDYKQNYNLTVKAINGKGETWSSQKSFSLSEASLPEPNPDEDWYMFRKDALHTAASSSNLKPPLTLSWAYHTKGTITLSSPIVIDKKLYIGIDGNGNDDSSGVVCLNAVNGKLLWRYKTDSAVKSTLAYYKGLIYAASVKGSIYCLDSKSGKEKWIYQIKDLSGSAWLYSSPLVANGKVYVGIAPHFVALDALNGKLIWRGNNFTGHFYASCHSTPLLSYGKIYVGFTNCLVCLDGNSGKSLWERKGFTNKGNRKFYCLQSTPAISQAKLYFGGSDNSVYALSADTGEIVKSYALDESRVLSSPVISGNNLYIASSGGKIFNFDVVTGYKLWSYQTRPSITPSVPYKRDGSSIVSSPVLTKSTLYIGSDDGYLYGLDIETGRKTWEYNIGSSITSSPTISGNCLYIGTTDGNIYGFCGK